MNETLPFIRVSKKIIANGYIDGKTLLVLAYLRIHADYLKEIRISIVWLTQNIGYKPKSGKGNITNQVHTILNKLRIAGAIQFSDPESTTSQIVIVLNMEHPFFDPKDTFVCITSYELVKITNSSITHKDRLIMVFLWMKGKMYYDIEHDSYEPAYPSLRSLQKELSAMVDISINTLIKLLDELVKIEVLKKYAVGDYLDTCNGDIEYKSFPNFYILYNEEFDIAECIKLAKESLRNRGIEVDRFIKRNTKSMEFGERITLVNKKEDKSIEGENNDSEYELPFH